MGERPNKQGESARAREAGKRGEIERAKATLGLIDRPELARRCGLSIPGTSTHLRSGRIKPAARVGGGRTAAMLFRPEDAEALAEWIESRGRRVRCSRCGALFARRKGSARVCNACAHPLRSARLGTGLSAKALAAAVGCSPSVISGIEVGGKLPGVALAKAISEAVGSTLEQVFGAPHACREDGCGAVTFDDYCTSHALGRALARARSVERTAKTTLELYMARRGLVDAEEIGRRAGCHPTTVKDHARAGDLVGLCLRFPGEWPQEAFRPWLFRPRAAERMRELLAEGRERQREAARRAGTRNGPAQRAWYASPVGVEFRQRLADRMRIDPVVRQCDLCGSTLLRKPSAVQRNENARWRFRCTACERDWQTAVMRARSVLNLPRPDAPLALANRRAIEGVFALAAELEERVAARGRRQGRPRDVASRLVIDVLHAWTDFSDDQIARVLRIVEGRDVSREVVKVLRRRYGIRRRRPAAPAA